MLVLQSHLIIEDAKMDLRTTYILWRDVLIRIYVFALEMGE